MNQHRSLIPVTALLLAPALALPGHAQIPMQNVLSRIAVASQGDLRGLVDVVGFPSRAEQMDFIGQTCDQLEQAAIRVNQHNFDLADGDGFVCGISPHDDYALAGRLYTHVHRYMKARTVILIGNAHWSETFGIRGRLIFDDFKQWRGPYGPVPVSPLRELILAKLPSGSSTVNRRLAETEHSLEAQIPYLQYFNRKVEIVPILVPFSDWKTLDRLSRELAAVLGDISRQKQWKLGSDLAILCSTDGQHYGDYGWSYYSYFPFGCDAGGYLKAMEQDRNLIDAFLVGTASTGKLQTLFGSLVDTKDISRYKITWCGRFAAPFGVNLAVDLIHLRENRDLAGCLLRTGSSLSDPWLPLKKFGLGVTADANLHHFVTYFALGYK